MKTIYTAVMARLKEKVSALRWIDFDKGQLEASPSGGGLEGARPPVAFPCALLTISVNSARDITDTLQDCIATLRVRLAFDAQMKTDGATPPEHLSVALEPYDVIADVYAALQGYGLSPLGGAGGGFNPLSRTRQAKENSRNGLFIYSIDFNVEFEDYTASG